jgi:threonine/homoserine/homoserine lactone efflux protein
LERLKTRVVLTSLLIPFLVVAGLFAITPGPDVAVVTRNALQCGRRAALQATFGIMTGVLVWTGVASIGLAAVLEANAFAFTVVKLAGAAYLGYLGVHALLSLRNNLKSRLRLPRYGVLLVKVDSPYLQGLANNILNPKVAVLFTSLIPEFVTAGPSEAIEFVELAGVFAVMGFCALSAYSILGSATRSLLRRPAIRRAFDELTGSLLVAFGVRTVLEAR